MNNKIEILSITGSAQSGKDSLYTILENIFSKHNIVTKRFAFADELKLELYDFVKSKYGISPFTNNPEEKTLIRGLMVEHGCIRRKQSNGTHWTGILTPRVMESINDGELPIITDLRFCEFEHDEHSWSTKQFNGKIIHIERTLEDGSLLLPANSTEALNDPKLKVIADFRLRWPTLSDLSIRADFAKVQLKDLITNIINERKS